MAIPTVKGIDAAFQALNEKRQRLTTLTKKTTRLIDESYAGWVNQLSANPQWTDALLSYWANRYDDALIAFRRETENLIDAPIMLFQLPTGDIKKFQIGLSIAAVALGMFVITRLPRSSSTGWMMEDLGNVCQYYKHDRRKRRARRKKL